MLGKIIVGVPGPWSDPFDLLKDVLEANGRAGESYQLLPGQLVHEGSGRTFELDFYDRDPNLREAFEAAGQGKLDEETLAAVEGHQGTAYLLSEAQTPDDARAILAAAAHLLEAGGAAVKVETSGVAHTAERWRYLARSRRETTALYDAFVVLVGSEAFFYSCGMHNLGLSDASVDASVGPQTGARILTAFNQRQLFGGPLLPDEGFQIAFGEPAFDCGLLPFGYDEESPLNNPHGRRHLTPAEGDIRPAGVYDRAEGEDPLFIGLDSNSPEVQATVEEARATLPRFEEKFASPFEHGEFLFKARFPDGDSFFYLWLALAEVGEAGLVGEVFEVPQGLEQPAAGEQVTVPRDEVYDWSIRRSHALVGGFSRRLQRRKIGEEQQIAFDLFSGIVAYAPTEELSAD